MWPLCVAVVAYAMNTFLSPALSGLSPFEEVFIQKPTDLLNLKFLSLKQFATSHKDYLQLLKDNAESIADILLDYKTQLDQHTVLNASMYQKVENLLKGDLVYLQIHPSYKWAQPTFRAHCTHCKLKYLENKVSLDLLH